jgi:hypothetical protein
MSSTKYQFNTNPTWDGPIGFNSHFSGWQFFVRDAEDDMEMNLHMHARLRSGDYFSTLAIEIDKIAQSLANVKAPEALELERIVTELLSIGQDYTVIKK